MEFNATLIAQLFNFVVMSLCFVLLVFVPVLLFKLNKRVKNIEDMVTRLLRNSKNSGGD